MIAILPASIGAMVGAYGLASQSARRDRGAAQAIGAIGGGFLGYALWRGMPRPMEDAAGYGAVFTTESWWDSSMTPGQIAKSIVLTGLQRAKAKALAEGDTGYAATKDQQIASVNAGDHDDGYRKTPVGMVQGQSSWVRKWGFRDWQMNEATLLSAWIQGERPAGARAPVQTEGEYQRESPTQPLTPAQKAAKDAAQTPEALRRLGLDDPEKQKTAVVIGSIVGGLGLLVVLFLILKKKGD